MWKDGLRRTRDGDLQRYLCRRCGYRFSGFKQNRVPQLQIKKYVTFQPFKKLNSRPDFAQIPFRHSDSTTKKALNDSSLSICEDVSSHNDPAMSTVGKAINAFASTTANTKYALGKKAKNLVEVESRIEKWAAGATNDTKSKILDYAWQLKKRGLAPATIKHRVYKLRKLVEKGANLMIPDTVSTVLALSEWSESNKQAYVSAYKSFAKAFNLSWTPPKTRVQRKLPFIPTEAEIDQLIAGCGKKTAAFLQVLKTTGARSCEASKLKWIDVDQKSCTIRINNPAKGSLARVVRVPPKTIAMINALPKTSDYIFNPNVHTTTTVFARLRNRLAQKLQNPRLKQIHFHTLRHWKATMEYHKTKNILYVKQLLGHKKLENTEIYTHLINFESDEWNVATARSLEEEEKLLEAGFEYVRYSDRNEVAIYRKRK